jgi:hypothetical protein
MGRKKKVEDERTCANCRFGPEGQSDDCDECEDFDAWAPKGEPPCDDDSCKISVNGGPEVPFPSPEATEQVTEMVKGHLVVKRNFVGKHVLEEYEDGTVSLDRGPHVTKEAMKTIIEAVQTLGGDAAMDMANAAKAALEERAEVARKHAREMQQLDLEGKPAEYPVGVEAEEYTVLTFECGSWTLKVREDRLERVAEDDKILALVQRRLKASGDLYPLDEGAFDRWVQRFARSLTNYVRTGCA